MKKCIVISVCLGLLACSCSVLEQTRKPSVEQLAEKATSNVLKHHTLSDQDLEKIQKINRIYAEKVILWSAIDPHKIETVEKIWVEKINHILARY